MAPGKAGSAKALVQNWEDCPREAELEALRGCGRRTRESEGSSRGSSGGGRDTVWPPGNPCSDICSHMKGGCRVSSAWECQHNVTRARGAGGIGGCGTCPLTSQGKKLATVRDMKELSKIHETSCMDCET